MGQLAKLKAHWQRANPRQRLAALAGAALLAALGWLWWATLPPPVPDFATLPRDWQSSQAWLQDRDGHLLDEIRVDYDARRLAWVRLDDISPALRDAAIAAEDHRFRWHGGVDWLALAGSARDRLRSGKGRGASTISMQAAAFLWPELGRPGRRTLVGKLRQMRAARALESRWNKRQILEAWFNHAPFRGDLEGIAAATAALYGRKPAQLDTREAAVLLALLPDPKATPARLARRACAHRPAAECPALTAIAANLPQHGSIQSREDFGLAPHLAHHLLTKPGEVVRTTLDARIQRAAIAALTHQLQGLGPRRVRDGAVIVLDNASGEVLAWVGGVGLGSTAAAVDGAAALRQAGSTLKPHLYAQLIEHKWLTAASILDDSPVQLDTASGLYVPRNYDNAFMGPVTVRRALANSLNVPAVRALLLDGVQEFRDRLWDLGYTGLDGDGAYYGFSLALGSAEVTLVQQANAYRTLANLGRWSPVRLRPGDAREAPRQLLDPAAAWIVGDILADAGARAQTFGVDSALRLPFWAAAKTGTSKAMRDNWCIGWSDRYTVAVWVGNLEGDPMRAVSGTSGAAPVWRDVMLALHHDAPGKAPPRPAGVVGARVAFAGAAEPPRLEWFLAGTQQGRVASAPAFARRPRITNPISGSVYAWDPDIPAARQAIGVTVAGDAASLALQLDGRPLGPASATSQLPLIPGTHLLVLVDASGRTLDRVRFTIR